MAPGMSVIDYDTPLGGWREAQLDAGGRLSRSRARQLACEAGVMPAVLGGEVHVLDLGRTRRRRTRPGCPRGSAGPPGWRTPSCTCSSSGCP